MSFKKHLMHWLKTNYKVLLLIIGAVSIYANLIESVWFFGLKPLTTILIIIIPFTSLMEMTSHFQKTVFVGLLFCLGGDVLILKNEFFLSALVCFLVAHLLFGFTFIKTFGFSRNWILLGIVIGTAIAVYSILFPHLGPLQLPVIGYMFGIGFMVWQGVGAYLNFRNKSTAYVALGASSFMLSDSLLAYNKFVAALPFESIFVLSTYWFSLYCLSMASSKKVLSR